MDAGFWWGNLNARHNLQDNSKMNLKKEDKNALSEFDESTVSIKCGKCLDQISNY
jgi:hypothetical protein